MFGRQSLSGKRRDDAVAVAAQAIVGTDTGVVLQRKPRARIRHNLRGINEKKPETKENRFALPREGMPRWVSCSLHKDQVLLWGGWWLFEWSHSSMW